MMRNRFLCPWTTAAVTSGLMLIVFDFFPDIEIYVHSNLVSLFFHRTLIEIWFVERLGSDFNLSDPPSSALVSSYPARQFFSVSVSINSSLQPQRHG
jgi:hypothetical protein